MKSFGSTLDRAGSSLGNLMDNQNTGLWKSKKNTFFGKLSNTASRAIAGGLKKGMNSRLMRSGISESVDVYDAVRDPNTMYNDESAININKNNIIVNDVVKSVGTNGEDTSKWNLEVLDKMNFYNFAGGTALNIYDQYLPQNKNQPWRYAETQKVVHSLFNPYYGIDAVQGMGTGQFITAQKDLSPKIDVSDCRIQTLVELSRRKYSILGQARYKYADFMFCKELGMPNNHLITLRRFAAPVGDRLHGYGVVDTSSGTYKTTTGKTVKTYPNRVQMSDIGHLCCYFGGEDNKLEDILKYSFHQTYKNMNAKIDRKYSQEDDRKSPIGMLINSTNSNYLAHVSGSTAGTNNLIDYAMTKWRVSNKYFANKQWYHNLEARYHVDANKIYEPKNTIQEIDYYEGKLQFSHTFTIVFSYKIRGYDNISPKAAMLDLIANVVRTCYSRGSFWGGRNQINGPQPNPTAWNKANSFVNNTFDKLGSGIMTLLNGGFDLGSMFAQVSDMANELLGKAKDIAKNVVDSVEDGTAGKKVANAAKKVINISNKMGITDAIKGKLKDALGRPQLYGFDSLLTGGDTGTWHLTIGNPLRPIITIGNLEVTNTEITHSGPLGIDDFPTELKVTVQFKHARPRDAVSIEKMYMFGARSIYKNHVRSNPGKIYTMFASAENSDKVKNKIKNDDDAIDISNLTQNADENSQENVVKDEIDFTNPIAQNIAEITDKEVEGLDYIGEFDFDRMAANMEELS